MGSDSLEPRRVVRDRASGSAHHRDRCALRIAPRAIRERDCATAPNLPVAPGAPVRGAKASRTDVRRPPSEGHKETN